MYQEKFTKRGAPAEKITIQAPLKKSERIVAV
jgi:hypothetical protein